MQATQLFRAALSRIAAPSRAYSRIDPRKFHVTTYSDLPSPSGSWQTAYDANQRKYNAHLVMGIVALIGSIVIAKGSGALYLNYNRPDKPAPRE